MSLTQVTSNVIQDDTIKPNKLTTGGPTWNSAGTLSAVGFAGDGSRLSGLLTTVPLESVIHAVTGAPIPGIITALGFIGDGSQLTDVTPALSVIEVTDNFINITPQYNNTVILLNSLSTINIVPDGSIFDFTPGHKTYFVQTNTGRGNFTNLFIFSVGSNLQTRKQYSVCELEYLGDINGWTLYGDLTSVSLTGSQTPTTTISSASFSLSSINENKFYSYGTHLLSGTQLYTSGLNSGGVLGTGILNSQTNVFTRLSGSWLTKSTGSNHTVALSTEGSLFVVGGNPLGNLGLNDTLIDRSTFTRVTIPNNPKFDIVKSAYGSSIGLSGSKIFVCGLNDSGQLGLNDRNLRSTFTQISVPINNAWTQIEPGGNFLIAISGTDLYGVGSNFLGQLGLNLGNASLPYTANRSTLTKITIPDNPVFTSVTAGYNHVLALSSNGALFVTGGNYYGELGLNDSGSQPGGVIDGTNSRSTFTQVTIPNNPRFTAIFASAFNTYALSGTDLYACGRNLWGNIGFGDTVNRSTLTRIPGVWLGVSPRPLNTFALSSTNTSTALFAVGSNGYGDLGLGDYNNRLTFTRVPGVAV